MHDPILSATEHFLRDTYRHELRNRANRRFAWPWGRWPGQLSLEDIRRRWA
jgi:hypothetical protein